MLSELRKKLREVLLTCSDWHAFTIDYFPIIFQIFTNQQDRVAQENILLQIIPEEEIESALLSAKRLAMEAMGTGTRTGTRTRRFLRDPVASFVGRKDEEARLVASLRIARHGPRVGIGGIRGLGGVGKTALAFKVAASLRDTFPIQILIELRGQSGSPLAPKEALGAVLHALRPSALLPDDLREMERRYHEALCGQPALILADDAADAEQIKLLLPPPAGCALLITTRHRFSLPDLQRDDMLDLDKLPRLQAIALLNGQCSRLRNNLSDQVNRLAHACGDLPIALHAAAGILDTDPTLRLADFLARLANHRDGLAHIRSLDDAALDVRAMLTLSEKALDFDSQSCLHQLGVMPGPFNLATAEAVVQLPIGVSVARALSNLYRHSLLECIGEAEPRYHMHDLVRDFALSRLDATKTDNPEARHAAYFSQQLRAANQTYLAGPGGVRSGLHWFDAEVNHLHAAQKWTASQANRNPKAAAYYTELVLSGANLLRLRLYPTEWIRWLDTALQAARFLGHRADEGRALANLGNAYADLGQLQRAIGYHSQCLHIAQDLGDRWGEGAALGNLGSVYADLGQIREAFEFLGERLLIARELSDRRGEGSALCNLGIVHQALGNLQWALELHTQHLLIVREPGVSDRRGECVAIGHLGVVHYKLRQLSQAIEHHQQYLSIARELGDRASESRALHGLSLMREAQGSRKDALGLLEASRHLHDELQTPGAEWITTLLAQWRRECQSQT